MREIVKAIGEGDDSSAAMAAQLTQELNKTQVLGQKLDFKTLVFKNFLRLKQLFSGSRTGSCTFYLFIFDFLRTH